jgi:predicted nucleic-acid-binding protein
MTDRTGIDTNLLVRWLLRDPTDPTQTDRATAAIEQQDTVYVNAVVLAEMVWSAGRSVGLDRQDLARMVRGLLDHPAVELADRTAVEQALFAFESGGAGFADHLIGALNRNSGCKTTLTFDKVAGKGADFTLLQ